MKKIIKFFAISLLVILPVRVFASKTDLYHIDATINVDGSVTFREKIVLNGEYNYLDRELYLKENTKQFTGDVNDFYKTNIYNTGNVINICVGDTSKIGTDFEYLNNHSDCYNLTSNGYNGMNGYYQIIKNNDYDVVFRTYNHSDYNKAFYLEYTITDAVVIHNDVAEMMVNFNWSELIEDFKLQIHLPDNSNELRIYSHGPINGFNSLIDKNGAFVTWDFINANTLIDARIVFDKSLVSNSKKMTNTIALDKIIQFETVQAEKQNKIREEAKTKKLITDIVSIIWMISALFVTYLFYKKYDKEYKSNFNLEFHREFPSKDAPEIVGYLLTKNNIKTEYLTAAILNLIYKKALRLEMNPVDKKSYTIYDNKKSDIDLTSSEKILKDWLLNDIGNGEMFTDDDLKKASKKNYQSFLQNYSLWKKDVIGEGTQLSYYEDNLGKKVKTILYMLIGIAIFLISNLIDTVSIFTVLSIAMAIILIAYICLSVKRSQKGNEEFAKWKGFKKFLLEFGRFKEKELPEIALWDKYLIYATVFGIADKVEKAMKIKIKELNYNENKYNGMFFYYGYNMGIANSFANSINSSVSRAISNASAAASQSASGSGYGGGSSFGGGGSGFGGGGGRG